MQLPIYYYISIPYGAIIFDTKIQLKFSKTKFLAYYYLHFFIVFYQFFY